MPRDIDLTGCVLAGRFRVEKYLDRGGMGTVWIARDLKFERAAVIKVPRPEYLEDKQFRLRFEREVRTLIQFEHPNIVTVYDFGTFLTDESGQLLTEKVDGATEVPFVALQYLLGGSLKDRIAGDGGCQTPRKVLPWLRAVASALDFMHGQNAIHRDVKPANVLYDKSGHVRLADFGIAKALGKADSQLTSSSGSPGTPAYMAPEIGRRDPQGNTLVGPRYDQYSLAVMAYQALSGRLPHEADSALGILLLKSNEPPRPLREVAPTVPRRIGDALAKALAKEPGQRFESCGALVRAFAEGMTDASATDVEGAASEEPERVPVWRRWKLLAGLAIALLASGGVAWQLLHDPAPGPLPMALALERDDGSAVPDHGLVTVAEREHLLLKADPDATGADARVEAGAEIATLSPRSDRHGWDLMVDRPTRPTNVVVRVVNRQGTAAVVRFRAEGVAPRQSDTVAPRLVLTASGGEEIAPNAVLHPEGAESRFTLLLQDAQSGIEPSSIALEGFEETERQPLADGVLLGLKLRTTTFSTIGTIRALDREKNVARFQCSFERKLPEPIAQVKSVASAVKDPDETRFLVKGWTTGIVIASGLLPGFDAEWSIELERPNDAGRTHVGPFPLRIENDELLGELKMPSSLSVDADRWQVKITIRDRHGIEKVALVAAFLEFDGNGPTLAIESLDAGHWKAVLEGDALHCALHDVRFTASDVNGPVAFQLDVDGKSIVPVPDVPGPGVRLPQSETSQGTHQIEVCADDRLGNRTKRSFAVVVAPPSNPTKGEPITIPTWADVKQEAPDRAIVVDSISIEAIQKCCLPWRVVDRDSGIEMILVPPGRYRRGAVDGDVRADRVFEEPAHEVEIPRPFYLGLTEVTNRQYRTLVPDSDHATPAVNDLALNEDDQPAVNVTWYDADRFCKHFGMRIPRDEEWEYACRAGTRTKYWWGDEPAANEAYDNLYDKTASDVLKMGPTPVAWDDRAAVSCDCSKGRSNPWGFLHMVGNVAEWTADPFDSTEYSRRSKRTFKPAEAGERASDSCFRGGSWRWGVESARSSFRLNAERTRKSNYIGFRVAKDP